MHPTQKHLKYIKQRPKGDLYNRPKGRNLQQYNNRKEF